MLATLTLHGSFWKPIDMMYTNFLFFLRRQTGKKMFSLKTDFEDIEVEVEGLCECPCTSVRETNSSMCQGVGTLSCGMCECNNGFAGRR